MEDTALYLWIQVKVIRPFLDHNKRDQLVLFSLVRKQC